MTNDYVEASVKGSKIIFIALRKITRRHLRTDYTCFRVEMTQFSKTVWRLETYAIMNNVMSSQEYAQVSINVVMQVIADRDRYWFSIDALNFGRGQVEILSLDVYLFS